MTEKDEDIAKAVQRGSFEQFGLLVERYEQKLKRYAKKFLFGANDAEDMVQEVFVKAYSNIQSFNTSLNFSSWIYRIAHNEFINAIKKRRSEPLSFFDYDTLIPHPTAIEQADTDLVRKETQELAEKYLNKLEAKYREPLVLYYFEDLNYKIISEVMHIPVSTVGIRIKRAKETLHKLYKNERRK